ncbi:DUF4129 domain-containing protein [Pseudomarimonas arenosa]|uniref:DUF4129 domain-containing protein n=1 Tax=Pseudomarimonas arenosa TaxID=2774145 RepID=A0AAW3ZIY8_9GAMM|nr:DUF4129 domain-containing protein [Pseudomarimonas arenosa]MBD8525499.1 DUF4129 domain-containing protein [Pseudomarimonas arenosa]
MRVDGLNIVLRQRPPWEAADLGMGLVRRHARVLFGSWALATLPVFLALHLALTPLGYAWLAGLLFWWLKPMFDRLPIYVLSRGILGQEVSIREALKQMRWGWSRIWPWLLWRRLHPARSLLLAMDLLEQPVGQARAERARLLGRGQASAPPMIWLVGAHLELMLWGSLIVFVLMLIPVEFLDDSLKAMYELMLEEPPPWAEFLQGMAYWLAVWVIEPFYVGAGFALYLNRRTELEAWDIELAFRRLAKRVAALTASVCLAVLLWSGGVAGADARAAALDSSAPELEVEATDTSKAEDKKAPKGQALSALLGEHFEPPEQRYQEAMTEVFRDSDLNPKKLVGEWQRIEELKPSLNSPTPSWVQGLAQVVAFLVENILWILLGLLLLWLLIHSRRWWADWTSALPPQRQTTQSPLLDPKAPSALPDDIPAAVRRLWQEGQPRAALSLLYRGAVAALGRRLSHGLAPGATESEVLRSARRLDDHGLAQWLANVVRTWQTAAYAHRLPEQAAVESLLQQWPESVQHTDAPSSEAGS